MRPEQIKNEINRLGISEKLILVEDIWDSIAADNSELPMSKWQRRVLDERYKEYKKNNLTLHDWKDIHAGLREKHK